MTAGEAQPSSSGGGDSHEAEPSRASSQPSFNEPEPSLSIPGPPAHDNNLEEADSVQPVLENPSALSSMDDARARHDTALDEKAVQPDGKDVSQDMSPDISLLVAVPQTQPSQEEPQHIPFAPPSLPTTHMPPPTASTSQMPIEFRIARSGIQEFQQGLTQSAIEVLLENPRVPVRKPQQTRSSPSAAYKDQPFFGPDQFTKAYPRKIRIRSPDLLILLEDIAREAGHSFSAKDLGSFNDRYIPTVFIYPFKLLVRLEPAIRNRLVEWERQPAKDEATTDAATGVDELANRDNSTKQKGSVTADLHGVQAAEICSLCGHRQETPTADGKESPQTPMDPSHKVHDPAATTRSSLQHLKLLLEVLDNDLKHIFDIRREIKAGALSRIAFEDLWHLFEFGQVVKSSENENQLYRVVRWTGGRSDFLPRPPAISNVRKENRSLAFFVDCVYSDYDGRSYYPIQETFAIYKYDGEKAITSLPVFPFVFDPDFQNTSVRLVARGKKWLKLGYADVATHKQYTGLSLDSPQDEEIDSQIIIDTKTALLSYYRVPPSAGLSNLTSHNPGETAQQGPSGYADGSDIESIHQDYDWDLQHEFAYFDEHKSWLGPTVDPEEMDDEDKLLLPPHVHGFVLHTRRWARFNVELVQDVMYTDGFDSLVLPERHKDIVRALVTNHSRVPGSVSSTRGEHSMDLVAGKGAGLVILLHGPPGVGKTSTAECVADSTKRPLFQITCGDIGDTATEVERNLESSFKLAHKWGCVLLLDEADIFLQKRDRADIKRNAIVSVFLRSLEYYAGILFLTTNRVGTFDPAFSSRIHLSLYYPNLSKQATMQIWKMHLRRTKMFKGEDFVVDTKEILRFAKQHWSTVKSNPGGRWNGRQIRNAFQTAIALAEYEAGEEVTKYGDKHKPQVELSSTHFQVVADASHNFDMYLRSTLGGATEADVARREMTRVDDFDMDKSREGGRDDYEGKRRTSKKKSKKKETSDSSDDLSEGSEEVVRKREKSKKKMQDSESESESD